MSNDPKSVATRYYEIMGDWAPEKLDEICSPDLLGHGGAGADLAGLKNSIGSFIDAFPDLKAEVRSLVCEGNVVSSWVTYVGTHQGPFAGVPGSGRSIRIGGWDLFRVEDGRLVELTSSCDVFTLMNQIGALPTGAPA